MIIILYINFEYIEYEDLRGYKKLNSYIKDKLLDKDKYYIFLDEIQKVERFEEVVNSLRASTTNTSIFITGSNSKLLSQELSTVFMFYLISILCHIKNLLSFLERMLMMKKLFGIM